MPSEIAEVIFKKVKILPLKKQQEVLEIVEQKLEQNAPDNYRPIWEIAKEISSQVADEEWKNIPSDGSVNHDHYLYGAPKKY